jgi:branched-chain amino acid transport system ATP-binding protein
MTQQPVLEVVGLNVRFGGLHALRDVDLSLPPRQVLALIGPNGAGKSTFVNAVTGSCRSTGTVRFGGVDISGQPSHARARAGLARTFQNLELCHSMSVRENLALGLEASATQRRGRIRSARSHAVEEVAEELQLTPWLESSMATMPYGVRKLTELGRALVQQPRVLLLDEPAAGMNDSARATFVEAVGRWMETGSGSVLLIEHDMSLVRQLAHHVVVMDSGAILARGDFDQIAADETVLAAYLGTGAATLG